MQEKKKRNSFDDGCAAVMVVLLIAFVGILAALESFAGPSYKGVRGVLSGDIHHAACLLKMCDEEGRCPVWADKYGKCYMLDREAEKFLKKNQKALNKEVFEEVFVK
jgi:hypothetical protein